MVGMVLANAKLRSLEVVKVATMSQAIKCRRVHVCAVIFAIQITHQQIVLNTASGTEPDQQQIKSNENSLLNLLHTGGVFNKHCNTATA